MAYTYPRNLTANLIKKQVIRVEKLVGQKNKFRDVAFNKKRLFEERRRSEERERKVEDRPDDKEKQVTNKIPTPKLGFLDVIKNFLFKILLGAFAIKLLPHLPKLKTVLIGALKFSEFILQFSGSILNAFATFIDKAYQIVDFGKQQAKMLGGDRGLKNYNRTLDLANKVMNSMFIAGMLFSDLVESDARSGEAQQAVDVVKDRVVQQAGQRAAQQAAIRGAAQISARAAAGVVAGVGLISSALGEGMFQLRKFTSKIEKDAYAGLAEAQQDPNPFMRFLKVGFYNTVAIPGMRFYNFISTGLGTLLDIIGAPFRYAVELINFGVMSLTGDAEGIKNQRENLGKLDARIREQIRQIVNTLSFGTLAKQQGSFGSLFGDQAVKSMGYSSGGAVTRGGEYVGPVTRTVGKRIKAKRTFDIPTSPLQPGADVGGTSPYGNSKISKIESFYSNSSNPGEVNPYQYLKLSYDIVRKVKFIHPILEVGIKTLFGDRPSESDFKSIGVGLNNFFNTILDTTKVPGQDISISDKSGSFDLVNWITNAVKESMTTSINDILSNLMNQFNLKRGLSGKGESSPSAQKGPGAGDNPLSQFGGQAQFVIGDSIAHGFAGRSGNGSESDDTMVGRSSAAVLAILKSRSDKLKGALIDLSTGIANSTGDWESVEAQLKYLKSIGARVRILGVGNDFSKSKGGINEKLSQLASKYGFYFYGGYTGGKDKLHGTDEDYTNLRRKRDSDIAAASAASDSVSSDYRVGSGAVNPKLIYDYLRSLGVSHTHALGILANIKGESDFRPGISEDGGPGVGFFQYSDNDRKPRFLKAVPDYKSNWKGQIAYAIKEDRAPEYLSISFSSPQEAAEWWMNKWERPAARVKSDRRIKHNAFIASFGGVKQAFHGGPVYKTEYVLTHPGEYVVDADSVNLLGVEFYDLINKTETAFQRRKASESLISILSQYTEDGFPETEEDYTYYAPESSTVTVVPPQVIPISGGYSMMDGGEEDPSSDSLFV